MMAADGDRKAGDLRDLVIQRIVIEVTGLALVAALAWAINHPHVIASAAQRARARLRKGRRDEYDTAVWEVRRDISRLEREDY